MGRAKGNRVVYFRQKPGPRPKRPEPASDEEVARHLETLTPKALADGINNLLRALEKKGVVVADYDHRERVLYKVQQIRGRLYFLAAEPED